MRLLSYHLKLVSQQMVEEQKEHWRPRASPRQAPYDRDMFKTRSELPQKVLIRVKAPPVEPFLGDMSLNSA
jgi:hypothetical protein